MDERGSYDGFSPTAYGAPSVAAPPAGVPIPLPVSALRPLSTGEVLDRTFTLYRRHFWLFVGIGLLPAALITFSAMVRVIFLTATHRAVTASTGTPPDVFARSMSNLVLMQAYFLPATLLFIMAWGISQAATAHAVTQIQVGVATSAAAAYRSVRALWLRWAGIALRQFWAIVWPMLPGFVCFFAAIGLFPRAQATGGFALVGLLMMLAGIGMSAGSVFGIINFLRNSLAIPAAAQEALGVNAAMRRSRALVAGRKGRIFLALLLVYVLQMVAGVIQVPLVFVALRLHGAEQVLVEAAELLVQFVSTALVAPVASIALCLFYIDERVRREGYDIELLMQRNFAARSASPEMPAA